MESYDLLRYFILALVVLIHGVFSWIIIKNHQLYLKAMYGQMECGKNAIEKETLRYQVKSHYIDTPLPFINAFNGLRLFSVLFLFGVVMAIYLYAVHSDTMDPVPFISLAIIGVACIVIDVKTLSKHLGYPPMYALSATTTGEISRFVSYYIQPYTAIYDKLHEKVDSCYDTSAGLCIDLLPSILRRDLTRRFILHNPSFNEYQAWDAFEKALKDKNYDTVLEYMKLDYAFDDLDQLNLTEHPFRQLKSDELTTYFKSFFTKTFGLVLVPWVILIFVFWFHPKWISMAHTRI